MKSIKHTVYIRQSSKIDQLTRLLSINPQQNKYIAIIYNSKSIPSTITTLYDDDWSAFSLILTSFIKLCHLMDPWSLLKSFGFIHHFLNDLSVGFNNNFMVGYYQILKDTISQMVPLGKKIGFDNVFQRTRR